MRALVVCACGTLAATVLIAAGAAAKPSPHAPCPLKPGVLPTGGDVQWAFSETGAPSDSHKGIKTSYTHGRGNWTSGKTTGQACSQDTLSKGPARNLVFSAAGKAKLTGRVTQSGLLGVRLVVPLRVSASDDGACAVGTRGTATLFASYFSVHHDTLALHFGKGCAGHNHRYGGSSLHVLITRHGAQVNTP
ncbi:MAG: hypothetical protein M3Z06_07320 [Actinomycetota bacterium]|nr:hypothetical protein [Actinomycetota bacterium]